MRHEPLDDCSLPEEREYVKIDEKVLQRFWAKVRKGEGCWIWVGATSSAGYGNFWISQERCMKASRVSFLTVMGYLPPEHLFMCHECDNPSCVRPGHLFVGTQKHNLEDMVSKGRSLVGDRNPSRVYPECVEKAEGRYNAKLTAAQIHIIRRLGDLKKNSFSGIGKQFGVSGATISKIVKRKKWRSIPEVSYNLDDY